MLEITRFNEHASLPVFEDTGHTRPEQSDKPVLFDTVPGHKLGAPACEPLISHTRNGHDDEDVPQTRKPVASALASQSEKRASQVRCQVSQVCNPELDRCVNTFYLQADSAFDFLYSRTCGPAANSCPCVDVLTHMHTFNWSGLAGSCG